MPGASRLLWHLHSHGIPMALATSTPRATYEAKMSGKAAQALCAVFQAHPLSYRASNAVSVLHERSSTCAAAVLSQNSILTS